MSSALEAESVNQFNDEKNIHNMESSIAPRQTPTSHGPFNDAQHVFSQWAQEYLHQESTDSGKGNDRKRLSINLCQYCKRIDMEKFLALSIRSHRWDDWEEGYPSFHSIGIDYITARNNCPACQLFKSVGDTSAKWREGTHLVSNYALKAAPAFPTFSRKMKGLSLVQASSPVIWVEKFENGSRNEPTAYFLPVNGPSDVFLGRAIVDIIDWKVVRYWLDFCDETHASNCKFTAADPDTEMIFIDCKTRNIVNSCWSIPYTTLSYVWGNTTATVLRPDQSLPDVLPQAIEDAMSVTTSLGFSYLWVDQYCIPQRNETLRQDLISKMDQIYANSSLTIIAAAGEDPSFGLPGVRPGTRMPSSILHVDTQPLVPIFNSSTRDEIHSSKWNTRGWTFQEQQLSKRKLIFTKSQVYFECQNMHCFERLNAPLSILHQRQKNDPAYKDFFYDWNHYRPLYPRVFRATESQETDLWKLVLEFNTRLLTYDSDTFLAFQGILNQFAQRDSPTHHLYAHPVRAAATDADILGSLTWTNGRGSQRRSGFPSWSWIGWRWNRKRWLTVPGFSFYRSDRAIRYDCALEMEFSDTDGSKTTLCWKTSRQETLKLSNRYWPSPPVLNVTDAWAFEATIVYVPANANKPSRSELVAPGLTEQSDFEVRAELDIEDWHKDESYYGVTCLITFFGLSSRHVSKSYFTQGLVLRNFGTSVNRMYERRGIFQIWTAGASKSDTEQMIMEGINPILKTLDGKSSFIKKQKISLQ